MLDQDNAIARAAKHQLAANTLASHNKGNPAEHFSQYARYKEQDDPYAFSIKDLNERKIAAAKRSFWPFVKLQCGFRVMHAEIKVTPMLRRLNDPEIGVSTSLLTALAWRSRASSSSPMSTSFRWKFSSDT